MRWPARNSLTSVFARVCAAEIACTGPGNRRVDIPGRRSCPPIPRSNANSRRNLRCQSLCRHEQLRRVPKQRIGKFEFNQNMEDEMPIRSRTVHTHLAILNGFPLFKLSRAANSSASLSMRSASLCIRRARSMPETFFPHVVLKASRAAATAISMSFAEPGGRTREKMAVVEKEDVGCQRASTLETRARRARIATGTREEGEIARRSGGRGEDRGCGCM